MRVRVTMPTKDGKRLKDTVLEVAETVEENDFAGEEWEAVSISFQYPPLVQLWRKPSAMSLTHVVLIPR